MDMDVEYSCWQLLPDCILLLIFSFVDAKHLLRCAQACSTWNRVALDNSLWECRFNEDWLPIRKNSGKRSLDDYKRLTYNAPTVERELFLNYVNHVGFSHDGKYFATCSTNGIFKVWNSNYPATVYRTIDTKEYGWESTNFSQFNESDEFLLVAGFSNPSQGTIAVFNIVNELLIQLPKLCKFGTWLDDTHVITNLYLLRDSSLQLHRVFPNRVDSELLCTVYDHISHILIAKCPMSSPQSKKQGDKCLIFTTSKNWRHKICFRRIVGYTVHDLGRSINMPGWIEGMTLSPDHEQLYVNVRITYNDGFPLYPSEINTRVVDLFKYEDTGVVIQRHEFYPAMSNMLLDVCDDFIASGDFLFDRRYQICISKLDDLVKSAAFNPKDSEMLVTTSGNRLKIWCSRNRMKEIKKN